MKHRADRLAQARAALRLSLLLRLREPACASLSLSELCKRKLTQAGKEGPKEALRCQFANGSNEGPYDLVIGCDGIQSAVRQFLCWAHD